MVLHLISGVFLSAPKVEPASCLTMRGEYGACGAAAKLYVSN